MYRLPMEVPVNRVEMNLEFRGYVLDRLTIPAHPLFEVRCTHDSIINKFVDKYQHES